MVTIINKLIPTTAIRFQHVNVHLTYFLINNFVITIRKIFKGMILSHAEQHNLHIKFHPNLSIVS